MTLTASERRSSVPPASVPAQPPRPNSEPVVGGARQRVARLATDRLRGPAVAAVVVIGWAVVSGWWTPRGPVTTGEALVAMAVAVAVGMVAGVALASRWAILGAPLAYVATFELVRLGAEGPTVDAVRPGSTYGLLALAVGRGFHGLLVLAPMALGAATGAGFARQVLGAPRTRTGRGRLALHLRRTVALVTAVGLLVLALGLARPAGTDPIVGADGSPLAGSVAELTRLRIGDHDLGLMIRGSSVEDPVLLFLAGGPGGSEVGAMRRHASSLEEDFVVVTFDQRGTGRSHDQLEPVETLTPDAAIRDVIEVAEHLRARFDQDRVYLVGNSWGTVLGVLAAAERPDLFHAFVGAGQMVSPRETDQIFWEDTRAWALRTGRDGLVRRLEDLGPPPYDRVEEYEVVLSHEHDVYPYDRTSNAEGIGGFSENLRVREYGLLEQVHAMGALLDVFSVLYPQIQDIDLRVDVPRLEIPVFLVQGRHEARGRAEPAAEWFALLDAPHKELITLDTSGHRPLFEQPERFHEVLRDTVLAQQEVAR